MADSSSTYPQKKVRPLKGVQNPASAAAASPSLAPAPKKPAQKKTPLVTPPLLPAVPETDDGEKKTQRPLILEAAKPAKKPAVKKASTKKASAGSAFESAIEAAPPNAKQNANWQEPATPPAQYAAQPQSKMGLADAPGKGQLTTRTVSSAVSPPLSPSLSAPFSHPLWQQCLEYLQRFLPAQQIRTWLQPLPAELSADASQLKIYVASRFKMDYTRSQYHSLVSKALEQVAGRPIAVAFVVGKPKTPPNAAANNLAPYNTPPARSYHSEVVAEAQSPPAFSPVQDAAWASKRLGNAAPTWQETSSMETMPSPIGEAERVEFEPSAAKAETRAASKAKEKSKPGANSHHLHSNLTFGSMVVGSANHMAHAAGMHVASVGADVNYNPLFIYGASGLGKTHLLHAIGNHYLAQRPQARVLYVHADKFVGDVVKSFRYNSFEVFRQLYYNLDLLMIDDVQEFSVGDKAKTLEEFFYIFQTLLSKHSLIIMTSDTYPKELSKIPDRLVSRFVSGLTVALEPPQLEMRVAILLKKAEEGGIKLPQEVAYFIAKNVQSNVRELEGALRNVHAYAQFQKKGQGLSIHTAREALRDLLSAHKRQITVENIQKTVADYYHLKVADMHSKRRPANIAKPRQIAMYLAKEMTQKSLPEIGAAFGGRDHTTVLHAVKKIGKDRQNDEHLRHDLHILEQLLKA